MDISEIRRRLRAAVEKAREASAERRARVDQAGRDYEAFLEERAVPAFRQVATALTGEGHPFRISTPAGAVRLAAERSPEEFVEVTLDSSVDPPQVMAQITRGRGRRSLVEDRPLAPGTPIAEITESDVVDFLVAEAVQLIVR